MCNYSRLYGQDSEPWLKTIKGCHKRAAERILAGCLRNGGLYVKLGQGLASMNHILPAEYTETLVVLQDKALPHKSDEVSGPSDRCILLGVVKISLKNIQDEVMSMFSNTPITFIFAPVVEILRQLFIAFSKFKYVYFHFHAISS